MFNSLKTNRGICILLALVLILSLSLVSVTFADDEVDQTALAVLEKEAAAAVDEALDTKPMEKTDAFDLSLEEALEHMQGSVQMQMIEIQAMADKAVSQGSIEGLKSIEKAKDSLNSAKAAVLTDPTAAADVAVADATYSALSGSKKQLEIVKPFAKSMLEPNDTARKNALTLSSIEMYYNLKNLEETAKIASDNYDITKTIYEKTKLKYAKGTVSKLEMLSAESDLNSAKDKKLAAEDGLRKMQMGFNRFFGYDLMQEVNLTSEIEETPLSEISLEDGIKSALENRNEIKEAKYKLDITTLSYNSYRAYPTNSSKYLGARASYLAVKASYDTINDTVEMDVRTKYMDMVEAYEALQTAKVSESNAIETARLANLQYDAGYCTLTTAQQAQLGSFSAQIAKAQAILDLALAVREYEYSTGYGVEAAELS